MKARSGQDARVRLFLQLAVIAFWGPSAALDLLLLWRDHGSEELRLVFRLLFRQSLVFLVLWFTVSVLHGLARGRREAEPGRRDRARLRRRLRASSAGAGVTRAYRGQ